MTNLNIFESVFKAADKAVFAYRPVEIASARLVTDLTPEESGDPLAQVRRFPGAVDKGRTTTPAFPPTPSAMWAACRIGSSAIRRVLWRPIAITARPAAEEPPAAQESRFLPNRSRCNVTDSAKTRPMRLNGDQGRWVRIPEAA